MSTAIINDPVLAELRTAYNGLFDQARALVDTVDSRQRAALLRIGIAGDDIAAYFLDPNGALSPSLVDKLKLT